MILKNLNYLLNLKMIFTIVKLKRSQTNCTLYIKNFRKQKIYCSIQIINKNRMKLIKNKMKISWNFKKKYQYFSMIKITIKHDLP